MHVSVTHDMMTRSEVQLKVAHVRVNVDNHVNASIRFYRCQSAYIQ